MNADGSVDNSFALPFSSTFPESTYANVRAIQPDGKVLVLIKSISATTRQNYVTRLNSNGSIDDSFIRIVFGGGVVSSQFIYQVQLQADGKILVGGGNSGFQSFGFLQRYNADGTRDTTFESPSLSATVGSLSTFVYDFDVQTDGSIVFVGKFDTVNSVSRVGLAKLMPAGNLDLTFPQTIFFAAGSSVNKVKILPDGKVLVVSGLSLLRFNADGSLDNTFNAPNNFTQIERFVVDAQGRILIGVSVVENGATVFKTLRLNTDGSVDNSLNISSAAVGTVSVLAAQPDGKTIIGGDFASVNNVPRNNLARVSADGGLDASFNPGTGFDTTPLKIVVQSDGRILVGGDFTIYNGAARAAIARLNTDGSLDNGFAPVISGGSTVYSIALRTDGKIYIRGTFSSVNSQTRTGIALLNADGSLDATFNPTIGGSGATIRSVAVQTDGKVLVGGTFSGVNGFNRTNLARFNSDGTLDNSFNAGSIASVQKVQVQTDGKAAVLTTNSVIRLNVDGTQDITFQTFFETINDCLLQPDGSIIIGGNFAIGNALTRRNIGRLKADGSLDAGLSAGRHKRRSSRPWQTSRR